jgi:glycerol-3-phosphate acyltransferase PlsX
LTDGSKPRVAIDAMGGDNAPNEIVAGAVQAAEDGTHVLLVGRTGEIEKALAEAGASSGPDADAPSGAPKISIVDAPDVIAMDDHDPARAIRTKRGSSIGVASRLVKEGRADAVFSAGSTGAALAAAVLETGRIRGVSRPAIGLILPFPGAPTVLVDAGANADVRAEHMAGFALLGSVFARIRLGLDSPRIGLLSVGEEPGKGSELVKAVYPMLESSGLNFIGNVEGRDLPTSRVDVVVTDGFTGNVVLKTLEGFGAFLFEQLLAIFSATEETKEAAKVVMPGLVELGATLSPETHGGAHLLGVKGVCIIGHGSSNPNAVRAAIRIASETVEAGLVNEISKALGRGAEQGVT